MIKTLNQLDFEIDSIYNITVMARDKGTPSLNSSTSVMVMVEDYNDCTPMFTADKYTKVLPENQALGTNLLFHDLIRDSFTFNTHSQVQFWILMLLTAILVTTKR